MCLDDEYKCTCWLHVTNHLITFNDKDSNTENRKLYICVCDRWVGWGNMGKGDMGMWVGNMGKGNMEKEWGRGTWGWGWGTWDKGGEHGDKGREHGEREDEDV
jgi:hypothetical protein